MSSTTGSQNLLTNILRPVYRYEVPAGGSTAMFTPRLDVCNIDVLSANSVTAFTAAIADENENVYVGLNAGNDYSNLRGCSNVTAVGYSAASLISNVKNSVYIGYNSGSGASDSSVNVAIGPNTKGNGISNIYIGSNTGSLGTGSNNILIGHNLTGTNLSNVLLIGPTPTIYGNLSTRKVGIGIDPSYNMDISGDSRISYRLGIGMAPGSASNLSNLPHALDVSGYTYISGALGINSDPADYTMNVNGNFNVNDGNGSLRLTSDGSGNSVIEARAYGGKRLLFNIQGDLCANSIIIPGGTFPGNLTASNVISLNDLSGPTAHVTNIYGTTVFGTDVSGTTARFGTLFANTFTPASITVANLYAANGTVSAPPYSFSNDTTSGLYLASASNVAITAGGVERLRVTNTHVGIGTTLPRSALDVSTNIRAGTPGNTSNTARLEVGGGYQGDGTTTSNSYPAMAFQYGDPTGGYRHFIRSRHNAATSNNSNAIDIFTNNSTTASASTAPATNNLLAMSITSGGVGIGLSNPTFALDVSGAIRSTAAVSNSIGGVTLSNTNITLAGTITGSASNTSNSIGGVTLSNRNIDASGILASNVVLSNTANGYIRNAATSWTIDISQGNISNSATTRSSNFIGASNASNSIGGVTLNSSNIVDASGVSASNVVLSNATSGYIRNAATGFTIDLSGGRVRTAVGTVSNPAFGFLATDICAGMYLAASNQLGIAVAGTARLLVDNSSVQVGNPSSTAKTALLEIAGGYQGTGAVVSTARFTSFPALALQWGDAGAGSTGGFRHFIRSRHDLQLLTSTNAIDFFTNNGTTAEASAGPGISNVLAMSVTSAGVGIGLSNPAVALDVSGVVRASNAAANAGVIAGFTRNAATGFTIDLSGGRVRTAVGTVSNPAFGFLATDISAGMYLAASNQLGIAVAGTARLLIDNSSIGIGTPASATKTALFELGGGYTGSATTGGRSFPAIAFQYGDATGGFRHFVRARHSGAIDNCNAIDFFTNSGSTAEASSAPGVSNLLAMSMTSTGVGIGLSNPVFALDVSGVVRASNAASTAGVVAGFVRNAATSWTIDISGGRYRGASNSVNNPTYAFVTDPSAGLYLPAASNLGFTIAGVERLRIGSNGNVGIGTTAPAASLDVSATLRVTCNATALFDVIPSGDYATTSTNGYFAIYAAGTTNKAASNAVVSLASDPGGNHIFMRSTRIGVGTSNPQVPLDVSGTLRVNGGSGTANTRIVLGPSPSAGNLDYSSVIQSTPNTTGNFGSTLSFWTHDGVLSAAEPLQRMTITNYGGVGVGMTSPATQFDVSGRVRIRADGSTTNFGFNAGTDTLILESTGNYNTAADLGKSASILFGNAVTNYPQARIASQMTAVNPTGFSGNLIFQTGSSVALVERMRINNDGNVGIGTATPISPLDVSGTIHANSAGAIRTMGGQSAGVYDVDISRGNISLFVRDTAGPAGLRLDNPYAGSAPTGNTNAWNQSLYFTGRGRAWTVGVETTSTSAFALGFFNYTAATGGPLSGTRFIRGLIGGGDSGLGTVMNFTGQHRCFVKDLGYNDISGIVGLIVSANQNQNINMSGGLKRGKAAITITESLPVVTLTSNAYDKRVFGVVALAEDPEKREDAYGNFITPYEKKKGDTRAFINSVGEGAIWVVNTGGALESGDYVCASAVPGYGQKQSDDLLHNYTVAKVSMDCDFTAPLQPKYIPLVDICGESVLDEKGNICWTQEIDGYGNPVFETAYDIRYVDASGGIVSASENAIVAAFLPCTYHCA